jgi:hypothetical protein
MDVDNIIFVEGKKYIWDSKTYDNSKSAQDQAESYKRDDFEVQVVDREGVFLVYSRRVVKDVVVEGDAPI